VPSGGAALESRHEHPASTLASICESLDELIDTWHREIEQTNE
jgi:hypothetical protein